MAFSNATVSRLQKFVEVIGRCSSEVPGDMDALNEIIEDINAMIDERLAGLNQNVVHYLAIALKTMYTQSAAAYPEATPAELVGAIITKIQALVSDPDYVTAVATNAIVE